MLRAKGAEYSRVDSRVDSLMVLQRNVSIYRILRFKSRLLSTNYENISLGQRSNISRVGTVDNLCALISISVLLFVELVIPGLNSRIRSLELQA